jgi:hypothetical protein
MTPRGPRRCIALLGFVAITALATVAAAQAPKGTVRNAPKSSSCAGEAADIRRAESQLPRLGVAPPNDQQIVCITLETNMLFARRLAAHLKQCPRSPLARSGEAWQRIGSDYTARFIDRRCKPAIRGYRG